MRKLFIILMTCIISLSLILVSCTAAAQSTVPSTPAVTPSATTASVAASTTAPAYPVTPTSTPISVSALELSRAYDTNGRVADLQYKGKELNITGVFYGEMAATSLHPFILIYPSSDYTGYGIECQFGTRQFAGLQTPLPELAPGQIVTVNGFFEGVDPNQREYLLLTDFLIISVSPAESPSLTPTPATQITQNQQPVEVVSVLEPPQEPNPSGGIVEITLKNVGIEPVVSLAAILTIRGPFNYSFDVTPSHPLLPGESISSQLRLIGSNDGFGDGIPYSVTINGTLQNGDTFSYTRESPDK